MTRLDELLGRRVDMRAMALLRALTGPIVLVHLWPFLRGARHGHIYRDAFYQPYAAWYPELPRALYVTLLCVGAAAAVAMTVGAWPRAATAVACATVTYNLFLSTTHYHHNRAFLVIVLAALAATPSAAQAPAWPLWLLRGEVAVVYGASGLSKLFDHDWFGGTVTWDRVLRVRGRLADAPLPGWAISVLTDHAFHVAAAKVIVLTELFIAAALWFPRTRLVAVWVAVCFHALIELSASVQVFSLLGIAALVIWATPSTRDRVLRFDPADARSRRFATVVRRLDWLQRWRVEPGPAGVSLAAVDRDGTEVEGRAAVVLVLSRLPLTTWFALPARLALAPRAAPAVA